MHLANSSKATYLVTCNQLKANKLALINKINFSKNQNNKNQRTSFLILVVYLHLLTTKWILKCFNNFKTATNKMMSLLNIKMRLLNNQIISHGSSSSSNFLMRRKIQMFGILQVHKQRIILLLLKNGTSLLPNKQLRSLLIEMNQITMYWTRKQATAKITTSHGNKNLKKRKNQQHFWSFTILMARVLIRSLLKCLKERCLIRVQM